VGDGGLAHAQKGGDVADAHFRPQEGAEDFDPGGIAENLKQVRQIQQYLIMGHFFSDRGYHFLMDYVAIKAFNVYSAFHHTIPLTVEQMLIYITYRRLEPMSSGFLKFFKFLDSQVERVHTAIVVVPFPYFSIAKIRYMLLPCRSFRFN
jgi:hypothetical protein